MDFPSRRTSPPLSSAALHLEPPFLTTETRELGTLDLLAQGGLGQVEVLGDLGDAPVADPAEAHGLGLELRVNERRSRLFDFLRVLSRETSRRASSPILVSTESG
ncbi:MAG: hypothetical protein RLZZ238_2485, partial [Planctomycetota bacterium]